jgi:hypothetical protein
MNSTPKACSFDSTLHLYGFRFAGSISSSTSLTTICDDETDPNLGWKIWFDTSLPKQDTKWGKTNDGFIIFLTEITICFRARYLIHLLQGTQNIYSRVINPLNNSCATAVILPFVVNHLTLIYWEQLVCSNLSTFTKVIVDAGIQDGSPIANYSYTCLDFFKSLQARANYTNRQ